MSTEEDFDHFYFDDEDHAGICPQCGNQDTRSRECDRCEEGVVNHYDEDPMWYEDKYVNCEECKGHGTIAWCPKCLLDLNSKKAERLRNPKPGTPNDPNQQSLNLTP